MFKICAGNTSASLGEDLSMDLWENFVSGMAKGYPDMANYDETAVRWPGEVEGNIIEDRNC